MILGVKELKASGLLGTFPSDADEQEHGIEMHLPFLHKATEK
jgi:predicted class III extradiol MEMO1 family dioxygenase